MPQAQNDIPVNYANGVQGEAVRTGNNAAWHCTCGRTKPLLGYSDSNPSPRAYSIVECPDCPAEYRVVAPGEKQVPTHVQQL